MSGEGRGYTGATPGFWRPGNALPWACAASVAVDRPLSGPHPPIDPDAMRAALDRSRTLLGRHGLLTLYVFLAMASFLAIRVGLIFFSLGDSDLVFGGVARILAVGFLYDLAFCSFVAAPVAVGIALVPDVLWRSRPVKLLMHGLTATYLFGLGFNALAEGLFWQEFQVRFNFISVDYLVYTHEVIQNIWESYPIAPTFAAIGAVALLGRWAIAKPVAAAIAAPDTLKARWLRSLIFVAAAAVSLFSLDQSLRLVSENPCQNELASNGPYQFVAAFRNNELDYKEFYPTLPL